LLSENTAPGGGKPSLDINASIAEASAVCPGTFSLQRRSYKDLTQSPARAGRPGKRRPDGPVGAIVLCEMGTAEQRS
jgi:hypothetical protein